MGFSGNSDALRGIGIGTAMIMLTLGCCAPGSRAAEAACQARFNVGFRVVDLAYGQGPEKRVLTVAVWYPTAARPKPHVYGGATTGTVALDGPLATSGGPFPLLIFSHGFGGSGLGTVFLTERLAARGWIVAAPDHHDAVSAARIRTGQSRDFDHFALMSRAKEITLSVPGDRGRYYYRLEEMRLVLDRLFESGPFDQAIDRDRIAVGGHSFGGFTALGLCGTIGDRRDSRIKAVLLYSTGAGGYLFSDEELARVAIPSMSFIGERERGQRRGNRTMLQLADKIHRNLPAPKYFLEVKEANHFSFNNSLADRLSARFLSGTPEQFEVISRYSIAFLERYVAGRKESCDVLDNDDPQLTRFLKETSPGPAVRP